MWWQDQHVDNGCLQGIGVCVYKEALTEFWWCCRSSGQKTWLWKEEHWGITVCSKLEWIYCMSCYSLHDFACWCRWTAEMGSFSWWGSVLIHSHKWRSQLESVTWGTPPTWLTPVEISTRINHMSTLPHDPFQLRSQLESVTWVYSHMTHPSWDLN